MTPAEASALKRNASVRIVTQDERFLAHLAEVRRGLAARGVSGDAAAYVEDLLVQVGGRVGMVYAVCLFVCILFFCSGKGGRLFRLEHGALCLEPVGREGGNTGPPPRDSSLCRVAAGLPGVAAPWVVMVAARRALVARTVSLLCW